MERIERRIEMSKIIECSKNGEVKSLNDLKKGFTAEDDLIYLSDTNI